jgi:hypothetical protein
MKLYSWALSKLDKYRIKLYRGFEYDEYDRSWAE